MRIEVYVSIGLLFVLCHINLSLGDTQSHLVGPNINAAPQKLSNCKVEVDAGIIDLSSLDNAAKPRTSNNQGYTYKYNPCTPIQCETDETTASAAICQVNTVDSQFVYNLGDQESVSFDYSSMLTMTFIHGEKKTLIGCACAETESFKYQREYPTNNYFFTFSSPCCCPGRCTSVTPTKKPSGGSKGLSAGSVILIIFFCGLAAYFIGGIIFMKFVRKSSGVEIIPNHTFWISLPKDFKNGVSFTISKIRGNKGQYSSI